MARIGPDWSPLQVVTTDPKCDTKLATMSFAPLIWLKIFFTRWPEKSNNLKILDFLKNIFILYPQRGGKRYFSLRVKARICYKCWRILLSGTGAPWPGGGRGGHGPSYRQDPSENWQFDILSEFEFLRSSFSLYYAILIYEREIYFSTM